MKNKIIIWLIIALSVLGTLAVYSWLPAQIPTHWNMYGEIDAMSSRSFTFFTALLPAGLYLLLLLVPRIDPKRENYKRHEKAYSVIVIAIVLFMVLVHWLTLLAALGWIKNVALFIKLMVGILFVLIGNVLPQMKFNYFAGIRTPWTLANEEVWRKTHRIGGFSFVLLGLLIIILATFHGLANFLIFIAATLGLVVFLFVYSYILFHRIEKKKTE